MPGKKPKHPRGKSGKHGGQFVKKGEADVTTNEHAKHAGAHPELHTTPALHKALTLLEKTKVDSGHRKVIKGELAKRTLQPSSETPAKPPKEKAAPKASGIKKSAAETKLHGEAFQSAPPALLKAIAATPPVKIAWAPPMHIPYYSPKDNEVMLNAISKGKAVWKRYVAA